MRNTLLLVAAVLVAAACGPKWHETEADGFKLVTQKGGATLGYTSAPLLIVDGYAFKDLDRSGTLDPYEDWRLPAETRAKDLASKLSIEEIAGLMLYSAHQAVPGPDITERQRKFLEEDNLRAVLVTTVESPEVAARWNNNVQAFVESLGHGIPANNSSDPRNETAATAEFNLGSGGKISLWPTPLGMAATFDPALVEQFGRIASEEYRALGIATALSPQIDLATEPRWSRFNGTFGGIPPWTRTWPAPMWTASRLHPVSRTAGVPRVSMRWSSTGPPAVRRKAAATHTSTTASTLSIPAATSRTT